MNSKTSYINNITERPSNSSWKLFSEDIAKLLQVGYGDFILNDDSLRVHSPYAQTLIIKRNMQSTVCTIELRDSYFLRTVASVFLLYEKHCRNGQAWDIFFGGTWEDVQCGITHLKEADIFDETYNYCLVYTDIIKHDLKKLVASVCEDLKTFLQTNYQTGTEKLLKDDLRDCVFNSVETHCPDNVSLQDAIQLIGERDILKHGKFYHVCIDHVSYWFVSRKETEDFLRQVLNPLPQITYPYKGIIHNKKVTIEYMSARHL